ncbi:sulfatase-like hydrolase/transferase [Bacteroides sp.]
MRLTYSLTAFVCTLSSFCAGKGVERPNIILIYADDMGKGMLSAYGQKQFSTPNIDYLISRGTTFSNSYGCMVSAASRASLLTGYHDCRMVENDKWSVSGSGRYINPAVYDENTGELSESVLIRTENNIDSCDVTLSSGDYYLAQVFKKAGYVTGEIGKLEWGWTATRKQMKSHGWDYYYGYLDHVRCHGFYPPFLFDNGGLVRIEGNTHNNCGKTQEYETPETYAARWNMEGKKIYSQDIFNEKIKQFIEYNKDTCFFLFHPTQLPHGPVMIPQVDEEISRNSNLTQIEKEYASMVKRLDEQVGIILEEARKCGIENHTIILFASDNGHEIYYAQAGRINKVYSDTHGKRFDNYTYKYRSELAGDIFDGNNGLAGLKRSNLEGGVRIPLVWYGPGIPKGKVRSDVVSMYDLVPTFAEMLGVELAVKKTGNSILQLIKKNKRLSKDRYIVYASYEGAALITNDGWKIRRIKDTTEIYNIRIDPEERDELSGKFPDKKVFLESLLFKECNNDWSNGICRY